MNMLKRTGSSEQFLGCTLKRMGEMSFDEAHQVHLVLAFLSFCHARFRITATVLWITLLITGRPFHVFAIPSQNKVNFVELNFNT
jgi:hypothetical protein